MFNPAWPIALALPLLCVACSGLDRADRGLLQPQTVDGPCQVKKFYLLANTAVHTQLAVAGSGQACRFSLINPDLQVVLNAAYVTTPAAHGRATAELMTLGRQAAVTYAPQPGYAGPDQFTATLEPNDVAVTVAVTVTPGSTPPSQP